MIGMEVEAFFSVAYFLSSRTVTMAFSISSEVAHFERPTPISRSTIRAKTSI